MPNETDLRAALSTLTSSTSSTHRAALHKLAGQIVDTLEEIRTAQAERARIDLLSEATMMILKGRIDPAQRVDTVSMTASSIPATSIGFHAYEGKPGAQFRWTGPDRISVLPLLLDRSKSLELELWTRDSGPARSEIFLRVDGRRLEQGASKTVRSQIMRPFQLKPDPHCHVTLLEIVGEGVFVPAEQDAESTDRRRLGFPFSGLVVRPSDGA